MALIIIVIFLIIPTLQGMWVQNGTNPQAVGIADSLLEPLGAAGFAEPVNLPVLRDRKIWLRHG